MTNKAPLQEDLISKQPLEKTIAVQVFDARIAEANVPKFASNAQSMPALLLQRANVKLYR